MLNYAASVQSVKSRMREISIGQMAWVSQLKKYKERKEREPVLSRDIKDLFFFFFKRARLTKVARNAYLVDKIIKKCKEAIKAKLVEGNDLYKCQDSVYFEGGDRTMIGMEHVRGFG